MGFSTSLKSNAVNEWKDYYLDYDGLKAKIRRGDFKPALYNELTKVNSFYFLLEKKAVDEKNRLFDESGKEEDPKAQTETTDNEAVSKKKHAIAVVDRLDDADTCSKYEDDSSFLSSERLASFIDIRRGFSARKKEKHITEFLHSLVKIKAYRDLNSTGFIKLARRYSEVHKNQQFFDKFMEKLRETYFYKSKRIDTIRNAIKKMYKRVFAKNQPGKARTIFRRLGKGSKPLDIYYIISGMLIGASGALFATVSDHLGSPVGQSPEYDLFYGINNVFVGFIFFGFCLKIFKSISINYKFIFNFDVVSPMNNSTYMLLVSSLMFINVVLFKLKSLLPVKAAYLQVLIPLAVFLNPFDIFFLNSRIYLMGVLARGIFLPISTIRFRHFYFIDVLQSFKYPLEGILGYFFPEGRTTSTFVYCIFPVARVLQCLKRFSTSRLLFPHIANASKYLLVILLIMLEIASEMAGSSSSAILSAKMVLRMMSTICSFAWDVIIDWAIIRNRYMYPKPFYLFALVFNMVVRFYWVAVMKFPKAFDYPAIESMAEISRRLLWTLIRVEVEHLNNCDELKIRKSISLTAGELFYKKDHEDTYQGGAIFETETEYETGNEEESKRPLAYQSENESVAECVKDVDGYDDTTTAHEDDE